MADTMKKGALTLFLLLSFPVLAQQKAEEAKITVSQQIAIAALAEKIAPYVQQLNAVITEVKQQHPDYTFDPVTMRFTVTPPAPDKKKE